MCSQDRQDALHFLTEGYESVAQMSLAVAHDYGYLDDMACMVVNPHGDDSSARLPYFIQPRYCCTQNRFEFASFDGQTRYLAKPTMQVLVYRYPDMHI